MKLAVIGVGLIGGSLALDLRRRRFADTIIGIEKDPLHASAAVSLGLVDRIEDFEDGIREADLVVVAVPVNVAIDLLPRVLDLVDNQIVTDLCSTKKSICDAVARHPRRSRFVPSHPMAGTEKSGPWAALTNLFDSKAAIICDHEASSPDAVAAVERMYGVLNMRVLYMDSIQHDVHTAYVSHISHISAYALALTVLEKERDQKNIFDLASGGFSSTVRLAKSSPEMWVPIFQHNVDNVVTVLDTYIEKLQAFRRCLVEDDAAEIDRLIRESNRIKRVLGS